MKKQIVLILSLAWLSASFAEEPAALSTNAAPASVSPVPAPMVEMPVVPLKEGELRLNLRNAPIDVVLSYLSEAAGFIIDLQTPVKGTVDAFSATPVTREEAVDILNSMLNKNGYAAIRNGRKLTIVSKTDAVHRDIPVKTGSDPETVAKTDEIITQIIPIRFVEAPQLVKDLSPLVSPQALIVANEAGNSIAVTDTQANIRHLMEIIKAIDSSAETEMQLRVFPLKYADPVEMASLLMGLFSDQTGTGMQSPMQLGGGDRHGHSGGLNAFIAARMSGASGGGGTPPTSSQKSRVKKRQQVVAVADPRTSAVVVTATKDLMEQIAGMVEQLDFKSSKETKVRVFHLNNADPQEVLPVLQDMFQGNNANRNTRGGSQGSPLMNRIQQNQNSSSSSTSLGSGLGNNSRRSGVSGPSF